LDIFFEQLSNADKVLDLQPRGEASKLSLPSGARSGSVLEIEFCVVGVARKISLAEPAEGG
jgi:hypothetical protein